MHGCMIHISITLILDPEICMYDALHIFSLSVSWTQIPVIEVLRMNTVHSMTCYDLIKML